MSTDFVNTTASPSTMDDHLPSATKPPPIRLWLVDDNDRLRGMMAEMLGREGDIQCLRDFDSPNGVLSALASKEGPDVILLDIQMGELSGLDAVRPIRSLSRSTRVVMFTSCYDPERHQRAMSDGASDFLLKHDRLEKIVAHIRNAARQLPPAMKRRRPAAGCSPRRAESPSSPAAARPAGPQHFFNRCLELLQRHRR